MKLQTKRVVCLTVLVVSILTIVGTVSYAYFSARPTGNNQTATISTANVAITFDDNDAGVSGQISLGETKTKKFTVTNTGTAEARFRIYWENLVNTFSKGSLSYKLSFSTSEDGTYEEVTNSPVPQSKRAEDKVLVDPLSIPLNETHYYKLEITYNYLTDVDQTSDGNASFSTTFKAEEVIYNADLTLSKLGVTVNEGSPDFAQATTDEGVFAMEDNYGTSYYYRGAVTNNYVRFANRDWRIIRVNGDGTLRIIAEDSIGTSPWNENSDDAKYVGYMFGGKQGEASTSKEEAQRNETESTIKTFLENWYEETFVGSGQEKYISDTLFCNDRSTVDTPSSFGYTVDDTGLGYGENSTVFGFWNRVTASIFSGAQPPNLTEFYPTLKCNKNDNFTVYDTKVGNGASKYPIGFITADEMVLAGSILWQNNINLDPFYLYNGITYWTFSPYWYGIGVKYAGVTLSNGNGYTNYSVALDHDVVPVINLSNIFIEKMVGDGSQENPFTIESK